MKTFIFYYWLENIYNPKETKRITTFDYMGDIGDVSPDGWRIYDWCYEEA